MQTREGGEPVSTRADATLAHAAAEGTQERSPTRPTPAGPGESDRERRVAHSQLLAWVIADASAAAASLRRGEICDLELAWLFVHVEELRESVDRARGS
jgi:hypothetical protein